MVLPGHPDRQVGLVLAVEVAGGQVLAEEVRVLGLARYAAGVLAPQDLAALTGQPGWGAVQHVNDAGSISEVLVRSLAANADRQIDLRAAAEVRRHQGAAELVEP